MRTWLPFLCAALLLPVRLRPATAQVRASEPATVAQTVDGTRLTIDYFRPRVRGRDSVFETQIFPEKTWTPGANWATTLQVSKRIELNGVPVEAGKYGVWFAFHDQRWTVILDTLSRRFHLNPPDSTGGAVRFDITPEEGPFTEVLTWSFPEIRINGGKLRMNFATRQVTFDFRVETSYDLSMAQPAARPFVGKWRIDWTPSPDATSPPPPSYLTVIYRNGSLKADWEPAPTAATEYIMIPIRPTWFIFADMRDGEVYDIMREFVVEFEMKNGKAVSFIGRHGDDKAAATGTRIR